MAEKTYVLSESQWQQYQQLRAKVRRMNGPGINNSPFGISIGRVATPRSLQPTPTETFPARVTGAWTTAGYDWEEVVLHANGTRPTAKERGRTSATTGKKCFHVFGDQGAYRPTIVASGPTVSESPPFWMHKSTDPDTGEVCYFFGGDIGEICLVQIDGADLTGGGKYLGTLYVGKSRLTFNYNVEMSVDPTPNLGRTSGGTATSEGLASTTLSCIIYNPAEYDIPTHRLSGEGIQFPCVGFLAGYSTTQGKPVVVLSGPHRPNCGSFHNVSANPTWTWARDSLDSGTDKGGNKNGCILSFVTSVSVVGTTMTVKSRSVRYDTDGKLVSVAAEQSSTYSV